MASEWTSDSARDVSDEDDREDRATASGSHLPMVSSWLVSARKRQYTSMLNAVLNGTEVGAPSRALASDADIYEVCLLDSAFRQGDDLRRRAAAGLETRIIPHEEDGELGEEFAAVMQELHDFMQGPTESRYQLASAIFRGTSLGYVDCERRVVKVNGMRGNWTIPKRIIDIDPRRFRIAKDYQSGRHQREIWSTRTGGWEVIQPKWPVIVVVYNDEESRLGYGRGLLETIFGLIFAKRSCEELGLSSLEVYAEGIWKATVNDERQGSEGAAAQLTRVLDTMEKMRKSHNAAFGQDVELDIEIPTSSGSSGALEREQWYSDQILQVCLGAKMQAGGGDSGTGSQARANVEQQTADDVVAWDRAKLDEEYTRQVLGYLRKVNAHMLRRYAELRTPKFSGETPRHDSPEEAISILTQAGQTAPILKSEFYERLGLTMPQPEDETVGGPPEPSPFGGGFGGFGDDGFGEEDPFATDEEMGEEEAFARLFMALPVGTVRRRADGRDWIKQADGDWVPKSEGSGDSVESMSDDDLAAEVADMSPDEMKALLVKMLKEKMGSSSKPRADRENPKKPDSEDKASKIKNKKIADALTSEIARMEAEYTEIAKRNRNSGSSQEVEDWWEKNVSTLTEPLADMSKGDVYGVVKEMGLHARKSESKESLMSSIRAELINELGRIYIRHGQPDSSFPFSEESFARMFAAWNEDEHPRDDDGKFGEGGDKPKMVKRTKPRAQDDFRNQSRQARRLAIYGEGTEELEQSILDIQDAWDSGDDLQRAKAARAAKALVMLDKLGADIPGIDAVREVEIKNVLDGKSKAQLRSLAQDLGRTTLSSDTAATLRRVIERIVLEEGEAARSEWNLKDSRGRIPVDQFARMFAAVPVGTVHRRKDGTDWRKEGDGKWKPVPKQQAAPTEDQSNAAKKPGFIQRNTPEAVKRAAGAAWDKIPARGQAALQIAGKLAVTVPTMYGKMARDMAKDVGVPEKAANSIMAGCMVLDNAVPGIPVASVSASVILTIVGGGMPAIKTARRAYEGARKMVKWKELVAEKRAAKAAKQAPAEDTPDA